MLSWDDFRYVRAISETRSLAGAALELGVNHSTVFRRLAHIEEQLGSRLFERSRAGYELTPCGEAMVQLAERMADEIVSFERQATGHDMRPSGELRVTTNDTLIVYLLSEIFGRFRKAYPGILVEVIVANEALNLSKRDADVAVRVTERPPEALVGRRLSTIGWGIYGPKDFARDSFDATRDARQHDWVGPGESLSGLKPAKWLRKHAGSERIVYRVNTVLGLAEAAAAGIGLALLPCFIGEIMPQLKRIARVSDLSSELWILAHPDLRQTARVRAFMEFTASEITARRHLLEGTA